MMDMMFTMEMLTMIVMFVMLMMELTMAVLPVLMLIEMLLKSARLERGSATRRGLYVRQRSAPDMLDMADMHVH